MQIQEMHPASPYHAWSSQTSTWRYDYPFLWVAQISPKSGIDATIATIKSCCGPANYTKIDTDVALDMQIQEMHPASP